MKLARFVLNLITSLITDYNFLPFIPAQTKELSPLVAPSMALHIPSSSQHPGRLFILTPCLKLITNIFKSPAEFKTYISPIPETLSYLACHRTCAVVFKRPRGDSNEQSGLRTTVYRQGFWKGLRTCIEKHCFEVPEHSC